MTAAEYQAQLVSVRAGRFIPPLGSVAEMLLAEAGLPGHYGRFVVRRFARDTLKACGEWAVAVLCASPEALWDDDLTYLYSTWDGYLDGRRPRRRSA